MFYKLAGVLTALVAGAALYAQKPVIAAVTDIEDGPSPNGLEMCRSLFNEYYLSELTTHAKVTMLDTASIQKAIVKLGIKRGAKLSPSQIRKLCDTLHTDALCLVKMVRDEKNVITVSVTMVTRDGKKLGTVTANLAGIGDTDGASSKLALESARILRRLNGINEGIIPLETLPEQALPSTVTEI